MDNKNHGVFIAARRVGAGQSLCPSFCIISYELSLRPLSYHFFVLFLHGHRMGAPVASVLHDKTLWVIFLALAIFGLSRNLGNFMAKIRKIIVAPALSVGGTYLVFWAFSGPRDKDKHSSMLFFLSRGSCVCPYSR